MDNAAAPGRHVDNLAAHQRPRHRGLVSAIGAALPGACWQRCRTHYLSNLLANVPKSAQPWVAALVRTVFDQPDTDEAKAQFAIPSRQVR